MSIHYYFMKDIKCFAKGDGFNNFIYQNGKWLPDRQNLVLDRLIGFDPNEEDFSPYRTGNMSVMREIERISEKEFFKRSHKAQ